MSLISVLKKGEAGVLKVVNTIELDFKSNESKALSVAAESQKITNWLEANAGSATVQTIEQTFSVASYGQDAVNLIIAANTAIQKLDTKENLDAIDGILLLLGARLTVVFAALNNMVIEISDGIAAFQKMFDITTK